MAIRALNPKIHEIKEALLSITKDISDINRIRKDDSITIKNLLNTVKYGKDSEGKGREGMDAGDKDRVFGTVAYTRKEDIIVTGLKIVKLYSQVVNADSATVLDTDGYDTVETQVLEALNDH